MLQHLGCVTDTSCYSYYEILVVCIVVFRIYVYGIWSWLFHLPPYPSKPCCAASATPWPINACGYWTILALTIVVIGTQ